MRGSGDYAALRVGYHVAAEIRTWSLTQHTDSLGPSPLMWAGVVTKLDTFWSTQKPVDLGLWMGDQWWIWDNVQINCRVPEPGQKFEIQLPAKGTYCKGYFAPGLRERG